MPTKLFLSSCLSLVLLLCFGLAQAQTDCKAIAAEIEILQPNQMFDKGSVKINFKNQVSTYFLVSLVGPKGHFRKDIQENEIKGLEQGGYTLVLNGKRAEDNFCVKHFEFIIK